jgi:AcrR family transcriptional regulator
MAARNRPSDDSGAPPAEPRPGPAPGGAAGRPLPRFHRLPADKRERILSVASREFTEHGFAGASLNRIIEAAGISKGAMYYYFHDKAHLYLSILEAAFQELLSLSPPLAVEALTRESFWSQLERYSHQIFEQYSRRPDLARLLGTAHAARHDKGAPSLDDLREVGKDWIRVLFERGIELGAVRSDVSLELMLNLWASIDSVADAWLLEHWDELNDAQRSQHVSLIVDLARRMWSP